MVDQSKVGQSFPPFTFEVEFGKIHEFALAIGDDNPIYHSREAARSAGYDDVPLFPTFPIAFEFWGNTQKMEHFASIGIDTRRILHGEEGFQYHAPVSPGDVMTGIMTLVDVKTTQSPGKPPMDIYTFESRFTNQKGVLAVTLREVIIIRG
jgi:acyl dehydratase